MPMMTEAPAGQTRNKRPLLIAGAVATAVIVVVLLTRGGTDKSKLEANKTRPTTADNVQDHAASAGGPQTPSAGGTASGSGDGSNFVGRRAESNGNVYASDGNTSIPLEVSVSDTNGLRDGEVVHIHAVPKPGSSIFGFEAWQCKGGTTYRYDADVRPTLTGKCVSRPLSPVSDDYVSVKTGPPYTSADGDFRVGVGTDAYKTRDGNTMAVTCGPKNPCTLVLELQYPNGFGFEAIPLTFK